MLVQLVQAQRGELALEGSEEWRAARAVLDRIPEYQARVRRMKATMAATHQIIAKVDRSSAALRGKLEERDKEKAAKKVQDAQSYSKVAVQG